MKVRTPFLRVTSIGLIFLLAAAAFSETALEYFERGQNFQARGDWYSASECFREALNLNPAYGSAWFSLAECTYELGEYSLAMNHIASAEKYARDKIEINNLKGFILIGLGKMSDAEAVFKRVLQQYPNNIDARFGLAQLEIFNGRVLGAEQIFLDALKQQATNRRVLLSLALVSLELGKTDAAAIYIEQALRYHSEEAETHYLASYIAARSDRMEDAERQVRMALRLKPDYEKAYELLANLLFRRGEYQDTIDICEYLITHNRGAISAWYLKGLSLERLNRASEAIDTYNSALTIAPADEILRSALEILALDTVPFEDPRRKQWAAYHIAKARSYTKAFSSAPAQFEYQRAIRLDPLNAVAREEYAEVMRRSGFPQRYLSQLKFNLEQLKQFAASEKNAGNRRATAITDSIEAYEALLTDTLASRWGFHPFFLDKTRWKIALYHNESELQLIHQEAAHVIIRSIADSFGSIASAAIIAPAQPVSSYAAAYRAARRATVDYFAILSCEETDREITLSATIFSARTGEEVGKIRVYRTGNDRVASAVMRFAAVLTNLLPTRGTILARNGNTALIDLGKADGIGVDAVLTVIKGGKLTTADKGTGILYSESDVLGTITVTKVDEDASEGMIGGTGFYDRVSIGDDLIPATPSAGDANSPGKANLLPDTTAVLRPSVLAEFIRKIR